MSKEKFTVTAALPYANGPLHLGHVAGVYLPSDIFVKFLRMNNHDVAFICGSDEHGAAITLRAKKKEQLQKKSLINTTESYIKHLMILAFLSIFSIEHPQKSIMKRHKNSLKFLKKKVTLQKRLANNITTKNTINS